MVWAPSNFAAGFRVPARFGTSPLAMLKILGKSSSINVRKVLWLCAEIDLPYEHEQWGSGFRTTDTAEFKALNPNATVPVIVDGDFVLWESNAICRYLAARQQRVDLLPAGGPGRARVASSGWTGRRRS